MSRFRIAVFAIVLLCLAALSHAQPADRPLANWSAPSSWTPAAVGHAATSSAKTRSATTQGDLTNPLPFIAVTPCRLIDTRHGPLDIPASPARGTYTTGETRTYDFSKSTTCTGLPTDVGAWSLMFQYTTSAVSGGPASFLTAWPAGTTMPSPESTLLGYSDRWSANSAIIPGGGTDSSISVYAQHGGDVIIDINGYYSESPASGEGFNLYTNTAGYAIAAVNNDSVCLGICGIFGASYSTQPRASAVGGQIYSTAMDSAGVYGEDNTGIVTTATDWYSAGVRGEGQNGVVGITSTTGGFGVIGESEDTSGNEQAYGVLGTGTYGVTGYSYGTANGIAAVFGWMWGSYEAEGLPTFAPTGVLGESSEYGVLGASNFRGTEGVAYTTSGTLSGWGVLGYITGSTTFGVYGVAGTSGDSNWGGYFNGALGASGTKSFVEPHPTEAGTVIRYVALEGPEAGTYFRGKGQFVGRSAVINVPESFRLVTDPEGLTIQVTPIGELATVAVVSIGLDRIVLKSSDDVAFFYTVNGVRHTFKDFQVMVQSGEFTPESADATIPDYLSAEQKRYLVQNGTYNADGTVNTQTAARLGWTKVWQDRADAVKVKAEKAAATPHLGQGQGQGQKGQSSQQP